MKKLQSTISEVNNINVNQFEIWMAELPKADENSQIQCGKRPVVIISGTDNNAHSPVVSIVTLTKQNKRNLPCHFRIEEDYEKYGLKMPSTIMGESVSGCNKYWLKYKMGEIAEKEIQKNIIKAINAHYSFPA